MLKIIYHCYGSAHSSVTAAAIHLGMLPHDRLPEPAELLAAPRFDRTLTRELGTPFFFGRDQRGHEVYVLGRGPEAVAVYHCLVSLSEVYGLPRTGQYLLVNALPALSFTTTVGGTLSRGFGLVWPGRGMTIRGIRGSYFRLVQLVEETKALVELAGQKE